jgi:hypothetical protein
MAMTTLTIQANETIDAISEAVTGVVHGTTTDTDEVKDAQQKNEKNETKPEDNAPIER